MDLTLRHAQIEVLAGLRRTAVRTECPTAMIETLDATLTTARRNLAFAEQLAAIPHIRCRMCLTVELQDDLDATDPAERVDYLDAMLTEHEQGLLRPEDYSAFTPVQGLALDHARTTYYQTMIDFLLLLAVTNGIELPEHWQERVATD